MTKVALFFKRWKNYSRHKKLNDDWSLATSLKDITEFGEDEMDDNAPETDIFQVKYLGSTSTTLPKSDEATAEAIKSIITTAKATNKKLPRVNMSVCPNGIECFDKVTGETVLKVSIYKISYCSADAVHSNVFAFVAGTKDDLTDNEPDTLCCHAFICQKRKIAHKLTLTVARSFESAFKQWQESVQRNKYRSQLEQYKNSLNACDASKAVTVESTSSDPIESSDNLKQLLIDFNSEFENSKIDHRELLQNTWVSFDDEPQLNETNNIMPVYVFENNMWERKLICSS